MKLLYTCLSISLTLLSASVLRAQCGIDVNAGPDQYRCAPPSPGQLNGSIGGNYLNFTWSPTVGMTGANTLTPTVNPITTTNYVLTATAVDLSNNLIDNGDFSAGNSGFTSDYLYMPGDLVPEGTYDVLSNPQNDHPGFAACSDHTGGGNMMAVNGSATPGLDVWCQTVSVTPNTQYVFSAWVTTLVTASPARLQFSINGGTIGPIFFAPNTNCTWLNFYQTWNSGPSTSANICIVNQNTVAGGNDFALDDIVFSPVCTQTDTVTVHLVSVMAGASPTTMQIPCNGTQLTLNGTGSSGPNVTYNWTTSNGNIVSGGNTLQPTVDEPGTYTLTVSSTNGGVVCTRTATVTVTPTLNPLAAVISPPGQLGCGSSTLTLVGNSNQGGVSYQWSASNGGNIVGPATNKNATVNAAGTYSLTVTNPATGCTATAEVNVTASTNVPVANITAGNTTLTCTTASVPLSNNGSTTGAGITNAWTLPSGAVIGGATITASAAGTYVLAVTNTTNNCTSYDTIAVTSNTTPPAVAIATPGTLDCDTYTVTLSATTTPATATLTWTTVGGTISGGSGTASPTVTAAGTYLVTVTNPANGCTATASVAVASNTTPPTATIAPPDTLTCVQTSITLSGNGSSSGAGFSYQWQASNGGNLTGSTGSLTPTVNAPGTYTLTVTNTQTACTATASVTVAANNDVVTAVANTPGVLTCLTDSLTLNANGSSTGPGLNFVWTTANGTIAGGATSPTPTVTAPGAYALLVTDPASGCSSTDTVLVAQDLGAPVISIGPAGTLTCTQQTQVLQAQLTSAGASTLQWTTATGNITAGDTTLMPTVNAPGTYILTATNVVTGCTATASAAVALAAGTPVAVIDPPALFTCVVNSITLQAGQSSVGPEYTYTWSAGPGGAISGGGTTLTPTVTAAGTYTLTVTNTQNGCTTTATATAGADVQPPGVTPGPGAELTCALPSIGLTVAATGSGQFSYAWQTTDGNIVGTSTSAAALVDAPGTYTVVVTDVANGCTAGADVAVTSNQQIPNASVAFPPTLTCTTTSASLNVVVSPATGTLVYQWYTPNGNIAGGDTTAMPLIDAPGLYNVTVTNLDNGCTDSGGALVFENTTAPALTAGPPVELTCTNPQLPIGAQNSSPGNNYVYHWTGGVIVSGDSTLTPTVAAPGTYLLLATNTVNGCTATTTATATANVQPPTVGAGANDTLNCVTTALVLQGAASAAGTLSVVWTTAGTGQIASGAGTVTPTVVSPGIYTITATDLDNGCTASDLVEIFASANAPVADGGPAGELTCAVTQTSLAATATTGPDISYTWSGPGISAGGTTLTPTVTAPGTYTLTVTNAANGCTTIAVTAVTQDVTPPTLSVTTGVVLTCSATQLPVTATAMAGGDNLTYAWSTSDGNIVSGAAASEAIVDTAGTYSVVVENVDNGCTASALTTVVEDMTPPAVTIATPAVLTCSLLQTGLTATVDLPAGAFTAGWTTGNGSFVGGQTSLTPTVDGPGAYTVVVTNPANGCSTSASTTVTENVTAPQAAAAAGAPLTCTTTQTTLSGAGSTTGPGIAYAWSGPGITGGGASLMPSVNIAGQYTLTVTDQSNGCTATATATASANTTPPLAAIATPMQLTCAQTGLTLNAAGSSGGPGFTALWSTTSGVIASGAGTLTPTVTAPGQYDLTVTNVQNGCTATATTTATADVTPPAADAGPAQVLHCLQPTVAMQGASTGPASYAWSTNNGAFAGATNVAQAVAAAAGTYRLIVTNPANGCTAIDSTVVSAVQPPTFTAAVDQPDCLAPAGSIAFENVSGGAAPLVFSIDGGQTFGTSPQFNGLAAGNYSLMVEDVYGCTDNASVVLQAPVPPQLYLPNIVTIEIGDSILLQPLLDLPASGIAVWKWTPGDDLSCDTCETTFASPVRNTNYTLHITDLRGCTASATMRVLVQRNHNIYAPNVIMPDGSGTNRLFNLFGKGVAAVRYIRVYDRWGAALYDDPMPVINSETRGWDGTYRGQPLNPGVFVWTAEVEFLDGEKAVLSGDVTVVR